MKPSQIIYLDNHLLVVNKPAGILIQGDKTGDETLFDQAKLYLKKAFHKPGNVYLGLIHRLDRPVSGVVVFARTSKAASRLSEQFRNKSVAKIYRALVEGKTVEQGILKDRILRKGPTSCIAKHGQGKQAILTYRRLQQKDGLSHLEITIETGRHHQIRVQLSHLGFPILGDFRYGSKREFPQRSIALHSHSITLQHPVSKEDLIFTAKPEIPWPLYPLPSDLQSSN